MYTRTNTDFPYYSAERSLGFGQHLHDNATVSAGLPLVARRAELAMLTGAIDAAKCGRGQALLVTGEAGVGKTRLLIEAQHKSEARDGWSSRAELSNPA